MSLVTADVGENLMLNHLLNNGGSANENLLLKLYKTGAAPSQSSVAADFTVADFTGYANATLTSASWSAAATVSNKATSTYAPVTWTCGATGNTVLGYYCTGATSGTLYFAEAFASSRVLANGDTLTVSPQLQLNSAS